MALFSVRYQISSINGRSTSAACSMAPEIEEGDDPGINLGPITETEVVEAI